MLLNATARHVRQVAVALLACEAGQEFGECSMPVKAIQWLGSFLAAFNSHPGVDARIRWMKAVMFSTSCLLTNFVAPYAQVQQKRQVLAVQAVVLGVWQQLPMQLGRHTHSKAMHRMVDT